MLALSATGLTIAATGSRTDAACSHSLRLGKALAIRRRGAPWAGPRGCPTSSGNGRQRSPITARPLLPAASDQVPSRVTDTRIRKPLPNMRLRASHLSSSSFSPPHTSNA